MTLTQEQLGAEVMVCRPVESGGGLLTGIRLPDLRAMKMERSLCHEPSKLVSLGRLMDYDTATLYQRTYRPLWAALLDPSELKGLLEHLRKDPNWQVGLIPLQEFLQPDRE